VTLGVGSMTIGLGSGTTAFDSTASPWERGLLIETQTGNVLVVACVASDKHEIVFDGGGGDQDVQGTLIDLAFPLSKLKAQRRCALGDSPVHHEQSCSTKKPLRSLTRALRVSPTSQTFANFHVRDDADRDTTSFQIGH
jgi:hypothetical protein